MALAGGSRASDRAIPEVRRKVSSAAGSLCSALSGRHRGTTLRTIVASARIEPGRLSVILCPKATAEQSGVSLAEIGRNALSLAGECTLRCGGVEARLSSSGPHASQKRRVGLNFVGRDQGGVPPCTRSLT